MARSKRLTSRGRGAIETQNGGAIGDVERLAVGCEILGRVELSDRLGFSRIWLGFNAPSKDGTVMVASPRPRKRSVKACSAEITGFFPQRRSY